MKSKNQKINYVHIKPDEQTIAQNKQFDIKVEKARMSSEGNACSQQSETQYNNSKLDQDQCER